MISLALVNPFSTASRTALSTSAIFTFKMAAASFKALQTLSAKTSSQTMTFSMSSPSTPGKKCFLIASMISLALVIPFTTKSLMNASTLAASTLIRAAISWILAQIPSSKTSSHLKLCTKDSIFARTNLMISLAFVNPFSRASRTAATISSTFTFKILAASLKALQTLSARTSSHTMTLTSPGKKCFLISSMISLALVIPLAMIPLMTFITSAILTFNFAATSAILSQMSLERASVHLKFLAISMSLAWTILKISLALVTPFAIASRIILSTSAALILNISAASRNFLHIAAERTSSQVMTLMSSPSTPGKKCFLIASMISLALVYPFKTNF